MTGQVVEPVKRKDKEVAINVSLLPDGSVVFDDISEKILSGKLLTIPTNKRDEGKIECVSDGKIYSFAEADRDGNAYTMQENDTIRFLVATDRRDQSKRAVSIQLDIDTTKVEKNEQREIGIVAAVKVNKINFPKIFSSYKINDNKHFKNS